MKNVLKAIAETIMFICGIKTDSRKEAANEGLCDYSGQGRDIYGK